MRLFEVADRFASDLETILRNILGRGEHSNSPQHLTYDALSSLLRNMGYGEVNQDSFSRVYDANPQIQSIVKDYDESGITLGTEPPADPNMDPNLMGGKSVDQMAHSAVSKDF